jgi:PAS domain S-box-containing protein
MSELNFLPTLLIVDDKIENLNLLWSVLKKIKVNIIKALSGEEALTKTSGIDLALAIVDVRMPVMSGFELAVKLNENRLENKVPVIFLTANYVDQEEELKGYSSGAVDYLIKPFSTPILMSKVAVFLDLFRQKQLLQNNAALLSKTIESLAKANAQLAESEHKLAEEASRTGKTILAKAQQIAHMGSWEFDYESERMKCSDETYRIFGYQPGEIEPTLELFYSMVHPEDYPLLIQGIEDVKTKHIPLNLDMRIMLPNGNQRYIHEQAEMTFDANNVPVKWIGTVHDITQRKEIEEELQKSLERLHQLSKHIEQAREDERLNIARELHDDLGQALTAVKIDLELIKQQSSESITKAKLEDVKSLVGNTIRTVQRITSQLRPEIIDDLGLEAAIEWYTREFSKRYGMEVFLNIEDEIPISSDDALPLFRIMQESLTNIARHSGATHIEILLKQYDDQVQFEVADNGVGITGEQINAKKSFGIMSMKERAESLGGSFEIKNRENQGSKIMITFPIKNR